MTVAINHEDTQHIVYKSPNTIDRIVSKQLLELSFRDRNAISEEIHGVSTPFPEETPEFLDRFLLELSKELDRIPNNCTSKASYNESQRFPGTYVNGRDFRLRFLRCELFDAKKAATRLVKFLSFASDLFGPEVLQRPMRITDFTGEDDNKILRAGNMQILPFRDRSGRPILAWVGDFSLEQGTPRSRHKAGLYLQYAISDDEESQRKGITLLCWPGSSEIRPGKFSWENVEYSAKLFESTPLRTTSTHFCLPDKPYFHMLRSGFAISMGATRSRIKFHIGEEIELRYKLKTYGIPVELIPVTSSGTMKMVYFRQWLRARNVLESTRESGHSDESIIESPRSTDVLFRSGTSLTYHPGNFMYHNVIESKIQDHCATLKVGKMTITKSVVDSLKQMEVRFLQWDTRGWWTRIDDSSLILKKVAISVKGFKKKSIARRKQQISHSSTGVFQNQDGKRRKTAQDDCCAPNCRDDSCRPCSNNNAVSD